MLFRTSWIRSRIVAMTIHAEVRGVFRNPLVDRSAVTMTRIQTARRITDLLPSSTTTVRQPMGSAHTRQRICDGSARVRSTLRCVFARRQAEEEGAGRCERPMRLRFSKIAHPIRNSHRRLHLPLPREKRLHSSSISKVSSGRVRMISAGTLRDGHASPVRRSVVKQGSGVVRISAEIPRVRKMSRRLRPRRGSHRLLLRPLSRSVWGRNVGLGEITCVPVLWDPMESLRFAVNCQLRPACDAKTIFLLPPQVWPSHLPSSSPHPLPLPAP